MAKIIDGKGIALKLREELKTKVEELSAGGTVPGLAVVLVGDDPASEVYVRNKGRACEKAGIKSVQHTLAKETTEAELLELIEELNADPEIHGILVQLPLPGHIDEQCILEAISPDKDVDGFHPYNVGRLVTGRAIFEPCTPRGIIKLIESTGIELKGKEALVVGRSNIVGKPVAMMLLARHATVTICHSRTRDLEHAVRMADVVIAAVGVPKMIKGDWIKLGAVVIDVGINRVEGEGLVGDVDFEKACFNAGYITPVPGGVGPMTIAMLLVNTVESAARMHEARTQKA
ncbi:Methenyltetrahydrofolate cyclohydrolase / Methylenetetrahydrofolate dehydrogenase (NADP+) [hydrothermal vent metagenome]|uniref:Methenyltetrahydrofolate cyclohydrolase / Methylenetetrahydrofolate dehydrogenase (NADP+) n=1 Tax=hydrothermal vent metagenome TaxID=652676 RepID=A0A3B0V5V4_9ZZZZ